MALVMAITFLFTACGGGDGEDGGNQSITYYGTQSPGDFWTWTLNRGNGRFDAKNEVTTYTYTGSYVNLPNGFLKITITDTTDPNSTAGDIFYAYELPGTALMVKPAYFDSKIIMAVARGNCPTNDTVYNWVVIPDNSWDRTVDRAYGTVATTVTGSDVSFEFNSYLVDGTPRPPTEYQDGICANGLILTTTGTSIAVSPSGTIMGDYGPNLGGFVGVEAPAANVDIADLTAQGREFRGARFLNNHPDPNEEDTTLAWLRGAGSSLTGGAYADFEGNVEAGVAVSIDNFSQSLPGIMNGEITEPSTTNPAPFTFIINTAGGKYVVYAIGINTYYTDLPYNVFFLEQ